MTRSWTRWVPLLIGVIFIALLVVGVGVTWNTPDTKDSATKVLAYYQTHKNRVSLGSYLIALSLFFGLFFFGALRGFLRRDPRTNSLATVAFGGGILFAVSGGLVSGAGFALADNPRVIGPQVAQALNLVSSDMLAPLLLAGLGVIFFATGLAIVRAELLPRWVGWVSMVVGVVSLTPVGWLMMIALILLVVTVGVRLATQPTPEPAIPAVPPVVSVNA
jgi:uncharacterized membrane protein